MQRDDHTQPQPLLDDLPRALDSLAPSVVILDAFAFRHKNQHSHSHWFSTFSILRRRIQRLVALVGSPRPKLSRIEQHARQLTGFVERAYATFSQLAADNQHAPLGVALVAVLASINSSLVLLLPSEAHKMEPMEAQQTKAAEPDRGISVSRSSLGSEPQKVNPQKTKRPEPEEASKQKKKKKKKTKEDSELSRLFGNLT